MLSTKKRIILGLILTLFLVIFSFLSKEYLTQGHRYDGLVTLENWPVYTDDGLGVAFQYPKDWKVVKEQEEILLVFPSDKSSRLWDGEVGFHEYGIRVMNLNPPYPAFPVNITEQDVSDQFSRFKNSIVFRSDKMMVSDGGETFLLYDLAHDNQSMLAVKKTGNRIILIEMGRHFKGNPSIKDFVAFWGLVASLRAM